MKRVAIALLVAFMLGILATSCHSSKPCPAYSDATPAGTTQHS
ncbi:MAG: hypothetical protein ACLFUC_10135 [Bacteroidales bacterium]